MRRWGMGVLSVLAIALALPGCGDDCEDQIAAGERFLATNLSCKKDSDCTVVTTGCHTFEGGFCSQSYLSRSAANSAEWAVIKADLDDCGSGCSVCDGALTPPKCVDERCGSP